MRLPLPSRTLPLLSSLALSAAALCAHASAATPVFESASTPRAEMARREKDESLIRIAHPRGICPSVMRRRTLAALEGAASDDAPVALNVGLVRGPRRPTCLMPLPFTPVDKPDEKPVEEKLIAAHAATPR